MVVFEIAPGRVRREWSSVLWAPRNRLTSPLKRQCRKHTLLAQDSPGSRLFAASQIFAQISAMTILPVLIANGGLL